MYKKNNLFITDSKKKSKECWVRDAKNLTKDLNANAEFRKS